MKKFAMKSIVAAASFVAVAAAQAATVSVVADGVTDNGGFTVTGSGTLQFSKNLASALSLGGVTVGAYGGATSTAVTVSQTVNGKTTSYKTYNISSGITGLSYDDVSGKVQEVVSVGGATQNMAANDQVSALGGLAQVGDLDVKFDASGNVTIYGKITGTSNDATIGAVNYSGALFTVTAANVTGATSFSSAAGTYNTTMTNLAITSAAFDALASVFALDPAGLGYSSLSSAGANFGTLNSSIIVTAKAGSSVPEPSTYALMGLGLVGMSLVARRRAK